MTVTVAEDEGFTCDFCDSPAVAMIGETNGVLACADHLDRA